MQDLSVIALSLREVSKTFVNGTSAVTALERLTLDVGKSEFVCIVGASGCGKSTLLNIVAGLEQPSSGTVNTDGARIALMFQESALFPWLTVAENIGMPLKLRRVPRKLRDARVADLLSVVRLSDFADERPHRLSGGMRQRVALARALAQDADAVLMDEPFGALDAMTRDLLHDELESIWAERRMTVLFVTHNVREAARLADRIVLLGSRPGRVLQEFAVDIPRPRRIESPEVSALAAEVTDQLRKEVSLHAG